MGVQSGVLYGVTEFGQRPSVQGDLERECTTEDKKNKSFGGILHLFPWIMSIVWWHLYIKIGTPNLFLNDHLSL